MSRVVAIDTAGPVVGVALWVDGATRTRTERVDRGTEALLVPWVQALCAEGGVDLASVDAIAVARGPGAFTGLRVGLATALGLAIALDRPIWPGMSLEHRARRVVGATRVLAMLDARKQRVYAALLEGDAIGEPVDVAPEVAVPAEGPFVATGEGALVYRGIVEARGGMVDPGADDPAVDLLAALAAQSPERAIDAGLVAPLYLREPDAIPR